MKPRKKGKPRKGVYDADSPPQKVNPPEYKGVPGKSPGKKGDDTAIRLNKYIANAGICSRREADILISSGQISVNGKVITELGYKINPNDRVQYGKTRLKREKYIYVLLNKPKDHITTARDPQKRNTVMDLVNKQIDERIYPVGRLDRNTTGLLLLTKDGELTEKLSHPSYNIRKIYEAHLDRPLKEEDLLAVTGGIVLEDGPVKVDDIAINSEDGKIIGIELHSGRNRIVRRIFESLGYKITGLDRVMYAFLTKKNLPRGKWRFLNDHEVTKLKYLGHGKKRQKKS
ncbi:MAG: rRNA pseudouridine synthase [Cyclobacteriaceae bacterium]|nr:rRNA pseudouridine synthase [Cyclobacteriaceae bacterium]